MLTRIHLYIVLMPELPCQVLGGAEGFGGEHWDDPVVKPAIVARGSAVVWDPNPPRPP